MLSYKKTYTLEFLIIIFLPLAALIQCPNPKNEFQNLISMKFWNVVFLFWLDILVEFWYE